MPKNILETLMGAVVLLVAGTFLVFAYNNSQMHVEQGYAIKGRFSNASGIALGSDVRIGGIKVGIVSDMTLDPNSYQAVVTMNIANTTKIPKDSSASIVSAGLLGEKYVQLSPGGDDAMMKNGDRVEFTQSSINLEEMIGKFMFSGGGVDKGGKPGDKSASAAPVPPAPAPAKPAAPAAPAPAPAPSAHP